jgi:transposase-like protein
MNGSNHFDEEEGKPLYMCPVCEKKLQLVFGYRFCERYEALRTLFRERWKNV